VVGSREQEWRPECRLLGLGIASLPSGFAPNLGHSGSPVDRLKQDNVLNWLAGQVWEFAAIAAR
jgi:hypothetical protein